MKPDLWLSCILFFPFLIFGGMTSVVTAQSIGKQIPPEITNGVQLETQSLLYNQAYLEMSDMLDGKTELSIKRAVFLAEWAYLDGKLDYEAYCYGIDTVVTFLKRFIKANKLEEYKTGANMALIEYFFNPYSGNGYKPFTYDFKDSRNTEDFTYQFVTKAMQTHEGQCRSLPYYYKILAEALGAEAYISYLPAHVLIRYPDLDNLFPEDWVNVELTTHQLVPEFWYREHYEVSDKAVENKIYLHPLTDKETVASQLADLALGYWKKYGVYDDFTWLCTDKSLEYYPQNPKALIIKGNSLNARLMNYVATNGQMEDSYTIYLAEKLDEISAQLEFLGWEPMTEDLHNKLEEGNERGRLMQGTTAK